MALYLRLRHIAQLGLQKSWQWEDCVAFFVPKATTHRTTGTAEVLAVGGLRGLVPKATTHRTTGTAEVLAVGGLRGLLCT